MLQPCPLLSLNTPCTEMAPPMRQGKCLLRTCKRAAPRRLSSKQPARGLCTFAHAPRAPRPVPQKADIWSCGVLLYAMVTDCYPFS